jgi:hypothetical protein
MVLNRPLAFYKVDLMAFRRAQILQCKNSSPVRPICRYSLPMRHQLVGSYYFFSNQGAKRLPFHERVVCDYRECAEH